MKDPGVIKGGLNDKRSNDDREGYNNKNIFNDESYIPVKLNESNPAQLSSGANYPFNLEFRNVNAYWSQEKKLKKRALSDGRQLQDR